MYKGKFEIHLTLNRRVDPLDGWSDSVIDGDPVLGTGIKFYLTSYAGTKEQALARIDTARNRLALRGDIEYLIREKIEEIVHDQRYDRPSRY